MNHDFGHCISAVAVLAELDAIKMFTSKGSVFETRRLLHFFCLQESLPRPRHPFKFRMTLSAAESALRLVCSSSSHGVPVRMCDAASAFLGGGAARFFFFLRFSVPDSAAFFCQWTVAPGRRLARDSEPAISVVIQPGKCKSQVAIFLEN